MISEFTWNYATDFATEWQISAMCVLSGYVPLILGLQYAMRNVKPLDLSLSLKIWNSSLSILSLYGFSILFQRLFEVDFIPFKKFKGVNINYFITIYIW